MSNSNITELIVVGLATYKRPLMLRDALYSLACLEIPSDVTVKLVLVDNDPDAGAEKIYRECEKALPFSSEYVVEPSRGISSVRNTILSCALSANANFLAFLDDDERACKGWLTSLYTTIKQCNAQAVSGKVLYELPENVEDWIRRGRFFCDKSAITGSSVRGASTANVLVDLNFVKNVNLRFHPAFNLSGGEDTYFFRKLRTLGGRIVWSEEAVTNETVPESRLNERWILGRAYKVGFTTLLRQRLNHTRTHTLFYAIKFILEQFILFLWGCVQGAARRVIDGDKSSWVSAKRKWYKIIGACQFLRNKQHEEYRHIDGN